MGRIELIIGCMYSGKTTEFIRKIMMYKTLNKKLIILTHISDTRYNDTLLENHSSWSISNISTHNRDKMSAIAISKLMDIVNSNEYLTSEVVFIEEAQFFPDLFDFTLMTANVYNKLVVVCGLDGDFQLNPFEQVVRLITHSESVIKLNALCKKCGDGTPACFSKRIINSQERELVGSDGIYEAVCRKHYY